jgi:hypothetical protein
VASKAEYGRRGLRDHEVLQRQANIAGRFDILTRRRRVGDRYTWVIDLETDGINPSLQPDDVLESTSLRIEVDKDPSPGSHYSFDTDQFRVLEHPLLTYSYATLGSCESPDPRCDSHCYEFQVLVKHMDVMSYMNLMKLSIDDRPPELDQFASGSIRAKELTFSRPASWKYRDDEVMKYLRDLLDECDRDDEEMKKWLIEKSEL